MVTCALCFIVQGKDEKGKNGCCEEIGKFSDSRYVFDEVYIFIPGNFLSPQIEIDVAHDERIAEVRVLEEGRPCAVAQEDRRHVPLCHSGGGAVAFSPDGKVRCEDAVTHGLVSLVSHAVSQSGPESVFLPVLSGIIAGSKR